MKAEKFSASVRKWASVFLSHSFANPEQKRIARLLYILLGTMISLSVGVPLIARIFLTYSPYVILINLGFALVLMTNFIFLKKGDVLLASQLTTAELWFYLTMISFLFGGINPAIMACFSLLIAVGGILMGKQGVYYTTSASLLSSIGIGVIDIYRLLPDPFYRLDLPGTWALMVTNFTVLAVIVLLGTTSLQNALVQTQKALAEKTLAQDALKLSRDQLQLALNSSKMGTWEWDVTTDKVVWSEETERIYGLAPGEFKGTIAQYVSLIHPDTRLASQKALEEFLPSTQQNHRMEIKIQWPDGSTHWVESSGLMYRDDDNRPIRMVGTVTDITERKVSEELIRQSEEKFRHVVENSPMGIHMYRLENDDRLVFSGYNPAADNTLNFNHELILGKTIDEAFPPLTQTEIPAIYKRLAREGGYWSSEQINYDDKVITGAFEVHAFQTTPNTMAVMFLDITERLQSADKIKRLNEELEDRVLKRTAELREVNENLESFAYSISHDLRAPLRAINGYASILRDEHANQLDTQGKHFLKIISTKTVEMGQLIDDLLNFSRTGRIPLEKRVIHPSEVVKQVIDSLESDIQGRQVQIRVHNLPECLADPALLRQVYLNLISNALKFTRSCEEAVIEIGAKPSDGPVVYYVRDNGIGFNMEYADKLFGVFTRLHQNKEDYEGTGVGLAIVRRIILRHGGWVWAEGAPGEGATIYFTLETL